MMNHLRNFRAVLFFGVSACSLSTTEVTLCTNDAECTQAFGAGSVCQVAAGTCSPGLASTFGQPRLGFAYSSSQNDKGWSQTHHEAALEVTQELDGELFFRPSVASADIEATIDDLIATDDANIIFTPSSGYITGTLNAANRYPDRYFISCCGDVSGPNLTSYFGRMYQPIYVLGYVAAKMSCTKRLGVVAALPLPQFVRHINAFTLGAKEADPTIEVDVRWVGAFFDPEVEGAKAVELIAQGSDVILAQSNSTAPVEVKKGEPTVCDIGGTPTDVPIYRIGYHSPYACDANPDECISSAYWSWAGLYEEKVRSILEGNFVPTDTAWSSMTNDTTSVVNYSAIASVVPVGVTTQADTLRARTIDDPQEPFRGPLSDNQGTVQIPADKDLTDAELDKMCWFVDGVVSTESGTAIPATVPSSCGGI